MTFGSVFGRTFSPTFQPSSQAAASGGYTVWYTLDGAITSCVAAYQAKGAASYAASKVNLVSGGTYDLTAPTADPAFDTSYGWSFTKVTKNYLINGLVPNGNGTWSMVVRFSDYSAGGLIGCITTTYYGFCISNRDVGFQAGTWASRQTNTPAITSGVYGIAANTAYRNGIAEANTTTGTGTSNWGMAVGGLLIHGSYNDCATAKIQACAFYNATLTPTQMANLTTAINAL